MKEVVDKILEQVEADISEIDLYGYNIIETSLSMVHRLQSILNDLRTKIQTYVFLTKEDEILFFKTQKPEILGRLLFFYKIYKIETQCPNGSDEVIRNHINRELDSLTYFFNRNLDFYQYYRLSHCGKQFPVRMAVVVLVKCPPLECDRMEFYKLFFSRCLGDAHPVSVQ